MKSFAIVSAALMLFATTASAGDQAVSKSTLEGMRLAGMQQMSDEDGLAVRGKGFFDSLGFGGFGGGFESPDGFGDFGMDFQLGDTIGGAITNEINGLGVGDLGLPPNVGIPSDLGFGSLGGFSF